MRIGRAQPYTELEIRRQTCGVEGCTNKAKHQWQCCATGNRWIPVCAHHDVELNDLVLNWMGHPDRGALMRKYRKREGVHEEREGDR